MACTQFPKLGLVAGVTQHVVGDVTFLWSGTAWEAITAPLSLSQVTDDIQLNDKLQDYEKTFKNWADLKLGITHTGLVVSLQLMVGYIVDVQGYYEQSDGGGNRGIVKSGAHVDDGFIIFSIDANTYVEAIIPKDEALCWRKAGAKGDKIRDDTFEMQKVINYCVLNRVPLNVSKGEFLTTAELTLPQNTNLGGAYGLTITGYNSTWSNVSVIYAKHTGPSILSLKGANGVSMSGVKLESDPVTFPKTAMILGRDVNVDSCGWHNIRRVWIDGKFSVAGIYSIASEENIWKDIFIQLQGGGAKYGFYSCTEDDLSVDSLPASSNIANSISRMHIWNWQAIADAACIYLECGEAMGSWSFNECYCIPKSGDYYRINLGRVSATAPLGPFSLRDCGGEIYNPVSPFTDSPNNVFNVTSIPTLSLKGLTIQGGRGQLINAGGTRKILNVDNTITLASPNIVIPALEDPTTTSSIFRGKIKNGIFEVANSSDWVTLALTAPFVNNFGTPYPPFGFSVDSAGVLRLRGNVNNGTAGTGVIAQLPSGFEPTYNVFYPITDNGVAARLLITTTGSIQLSVGTGAQVELGGVAFKLNQL